jgi:hypothetical protein
MDTVVRTTPLGDEMQKTAFVVGILGVMVSPVLASGAPSSAISTAAPAGPRKPIVSQEVFAVVPGNLEEMYAEADEVLDVQIVSSSVKGVGDDVKNPYVRTFYVARVLQKRKGSPKGEVIFTQAAGDLEFPDRILRANGEPLKVGERYVVFLRLNARFGGRMLVGERSGAFRVTNGRVEPQGFGKIAEEQRNLSERSFVDELERISRRSAVKE